MPTDTAPAVINAPAPKPGPTAVPATPIANPTDYQPPKPGSAMDEMFSRIEKSYSRSADQILATTTKRDDKPPEPILTEKPAETTPAKTDETPVAEPVEEPAKETDDLLEPATSEPGTKPEETPKPEETAAPAEAKKKVSPWKLVDEHKAARLKAEAEVVELRKLIPNEQQRKEEVARLEKAEAQNKELLEHLRFVDYRNHPEFKEKFEQPYTDKWTSIMKRLAGVAITEADGTKRIVEPKDIAQLGNLPADQAIDLAEQKFGKLGTWVAERVEELRQLDEAKWTALEKVKKEGTERAQREMETQTKQQKEISEFLNKTWEKTTQEIETHSKYGEFFKPKEGDEEFNTRLQKGTELVDSAFRKNPADPSLTPQERESIIRKHAAVRQRARAFSTQNLTIQRQRAELAALKEKLKQYESSTPKVEGGTAPPDNNQPADPWNRLFTSLEAHAKNPI